MNNSWDNEDRSPKRRSDFDWSKFVIGFGLLVLVLVLFGRGVYWITQNETKIETWARGKAKDDWFDAREIVAKLQTQEGTIVLYRNNPKLRKKFPSDQDFFKAIGKWRSKFESLPETIPSSESKRFGHRIGLGGGMATVSYQMNNGAWLSISWDSPSTNPARQIVDIDIY